jgi:hypothetical protein
VGKMLLYHPIDFRLPRGVTAKQWWEQTRERYAAWSNDAPTCRSTPKLTELRHWKDGVFIALIGGQLEAYPGYYDARAGGFRTYWGLAFRSYDAARQRRATHRYADPWGRTPKEQTVRYQERPFKRRLPPSISDERSKQEQKKERIVELRRVIQQNHPDKGGDVSRFRAAMKELRGLRK